MKRYNDFLFESALSEHAERELKLIGMFENGDGKEYNATIAKCILDLIKIFSEQGHTGFTAEYVREMFTKLSNWENLAELTTEIEEWDDVSDISDVKPGTFWQNKRNSAWFAKNPNDKSTWFCVNENLKKSLKLIQ